MPVAVARPRAVAGAVAVTREDMAARVAGIVAEWIRGRGVYAPRSRLDGVDTCQPIRRACVLVYDRNSGSSVATTGNTRINQPAAAWHTAGPPRLSAMNRIGNVGNTLDKAAAPEPQTLDAFLAAVERKAFVIARLSVGNDDDALDIVQDAMLRLCENYADRPASEWAPLFYRILDNRIVDRHRPRGFERLKRWLGPAGAAPDGFDGGLGPDAVDLLPGAVSGPDELADASRHIASLNARLAQLPHRQRQVFLLRCWQGMGVEETARALGISAGSVKTHLSRAMAALGRHFQEVSDE